MHVNEAINIIKSLILAHEKRFSELSNKYENWQPAQAVSCDMLKVIFFFKFKHKHTHRPITLNLDTFKDCILFKKNLKYLLKN